MSVRSNCVSTFALLALCGQLSVACSSKSDSSSNTAAGSAGLAEAGGVSGSSALGGTGGAAPATPSSVTIMSRFPAAAASVCADAPLRLTFSEPVTVGHAGTVQLFKTSAPDMAIASIDIAAAYFHNTIEGRQFFNVRPIFIEGNDAVIYLNTGATKTPDSYFVTIDAGVFVDAMGNPLPAISGPDGWQFSTVAPAPADPTQLTVEREGGGDFCTVQGAIDFIPAMNMTPTTITLKKGTYHEVVFIPAKHNLTLHGEDRKQSIIAYPNNDALNMKLGVGFRATIEAEASNGLTIENLTVHNTTPQGGSQAEAVRIEPGDKAILRDSDFISTQDTLLISGRAYIENSYIEGNVDYIWGKGAAYFEKVEVKTVNRPGYLVQARNTVANFGYVFVDSTFTSDGKSNGTYLGRIEGDRFPYSNVTYLNCKFDGFIQPKGWLITNATGPSVDTLDLSHLQFSEYQSTDMAGMPLDVSMRDPHSKQLMAAEATMMRDKATVLAGWDPTVTVPTP